jgi:hypothetical protein
VLLLLLVSSPFLQIFFPLGIKETRDSIAGWSYGLAQIAFGLVAAFVIFLLPQIVEIGRLRWKWDQAFRYYEATGTFNRDAAFSDLSIALEANSNSTPTSSQFPQHIEQWIVEQKSRPLNQPMTIEEVDKSINLLTHELKDLIESEEQWKLMVEKSAMAIHYPWASDTMRRFLFAAYSSRKLRSKSRTLIALLITLIIISLMFGSLAFAPDPFLYMWFTKKITGWPLPRSEPNYPEMSLWIMACIYLLNISCLTIWFALVTRSLHVHDIDTFDRETP